MTVIIDNYSMFPWRWLPRVHRSMRTFRHGRQFGFSIRWGRWYVSFYGPEIVWPHLQGRK